MLFTLLLLPLLSLTSACQQLAPMRENPAVHFVCKNGQSLDVRFDNQQQKAVIRYQNKTITLPQQPSGSGFRYADAAHEIRGKGNALTVSLTPDQQIQCVAYP
ncbi:hypothetical protein HR45_15280 [Shewanella mangrovi]|uniref:C-type lysozyme inhibitor domain-containing protein n=1 Tax=Shewanella mangrovi TaxID=1515746 RepID=A0A094JF37_9GAMM|nr:hypothetical protein HR45_15280 [Shewanella mangrovi]